MLRCDQGPHSTRSSVISREPIGGCHTVQDAMMAENSMTICPCPLDIYNLVRDWSC